MARIKALRQLRFAALGTPVLVSFARAVHDRYGMAVLNRAWESPETLPRAEELRDFERCYRRVGAGGAAVAVR